MRSRTVRLSFSVLSWIAIGVSAYLVVRSETQLSNLRVSERRFEQSASDAVDLIAGLRVAQQSYVAEGQGASAWAPRVGETTARLASALTTLQEAATTTSARSALEEAEATLAEFTRVDKRARDYLESEQPLMAGDVIFTEGGQSAADVARGLQAARAAEATALDQSEALVRRREVAALAASGGIAILVTLLLGLTKIPSSSAPSHEAVQTPEQPELSIAAGAPAPTLDATSTGEHQVLPALKAAANICTDFGCVRDAAGVQSLLARAGEAMGAAGLVVWLGTSSGAELQPVLAEGYSEDVRRRLPTMPRSADNAAAAAYRSGQIQLVRPQPGSSSRSSAAVVAPMLSAQGCIGALSIELKRGLEISDTVDALASIVAAQLATVLAPAESQRPGARAASL